MMTLGFCGIGFHDVSSETKTRAACRLISDIWIFEKPPPGGFFF